ncbi:MAG: ribosome biogenesis GTPase YlqF, partial [Oscillospiraceae bacterium]
KVEYSKNLQTRYKIEDEIEGMMGYDILEIIGKKRGCVMSGGRIDTFRAANMVLDDFRAAKMGNITLELPQ